MPKMSPEERAELEARLAADDDEDDDGDEVEIGFNGQTFRGTWKRAQQVAGAWGFKLLPDPPEPKEGEGVKGGKGSKGEGGEVRRFAGRRIS